MMIGFLDLFRFCNNRLEPYNRSPNIVLSDESLGYGYYSRVKGSRNSAPVHKKKVTYVMSRRY